MASINDKIVIGFTDVRRQLEGLPKSIVNKVVRRAVYAGATVVRNAAREKVPVDTGALKASIVARANKNKKGEISASVGIVRRVYKRGNKKGQQSRRYAHLVEFGTAHSAAQPFMRPAMDTRIDEILDTTAAKMREGIGEEARKKQ
jgi:HK97 gp10 family phage protein